MLLAFSYIRYIQLRKIQEWYFGHFNEDVFPFQMVYYTLKMRFINRFCAGGYILFAA